MRIVNHGDQHAELWREGVITRMRSSAAVGAAQLCIFEQWCDPGAGAPSHQHAVEEVLTILDGQADLWIEGEAATISTGQSIVVPAGAMHGFRNNGSATLHLLATLAAPIFEAAYSDHSEMPRRWLPGPFPPETGDQAQQPPTNDA